MARSPVADHNPANLIRVAVETRTRLRPSAVLHHVPSRVTNDLRMWAALGRALPTCLPRNRKRQFAQDVVEYGLLLGGIALIVLLGVTAFGHQILPWLLQLSGHITTVGT